MAAPRRILLKEVVTFMFTDIAPSEIALWRPFQPTGRTILR